MSFQGDVAGIGLGELLQGLARGERNGVLTLSGKNLSANVGMRKGQVYILPGPGENEDLWRDRAVRAFADDPDANLESSRRGSIARAARLETFYQTMASEHLHFRFEPGPLPPPPSSGLMASAPEPARVQRGIQFDAGSDLDYAEDDSSHRGTGMPVEYLLLEHARISDEVRTGLGAQIFGFDLPRALDPETQPPDVRDFLEQCNGASTIQEIADRLGWPLSKCRGVIGEYMRVGLVRIAESRELLAAAQREMELGRAGRAATRLTGWLARSQPGLPTTADAQLLLGEWSKERLQKALAVIEPRHARALLRKLDRLQSDQVAIHARWKTLSAAHKQDEVALLHEVALRLVSATPNNRTFSDVLRLAHSFHERGLQNRTRVLLRLCASHLPEGAPIRVELGRRMLDAGLQAEGSRWLLNTARELLKHKDCGAALLPIRAVLRVMPEHAEARALLEETQLAQVRANRRRWNLSVGLAAGLALSLVAAVKFHSYREAQRWVANVSGQSPSNALALLDQEFGSEPPQRIAELRERLRNQAEEELRRTYEEWSQRFREAEETCRFGDPLLGFTKAVELPPLPAGASAATPDTSELLGQLAKRLGGIAKELDVPADAPLESLNEEERLLDLLGEIQGQLTAPGVPASAHSFQFRVKELREEILERRGARAAERERFQAKEKVQNQDILLATARAHDQAGDLERSLVAYGRLLESDESLGQIPELQKEIERVRQHNEALKKAIVLCGEGSYAEAEAELVGVCPRPIEHLLPYPVQSLPSGARVTLSDGRVRTAPFTAKSGFGEHVTMTFTLPGFQEQTVEVLKPHAVVAYLHRFPERTWQSTHRIEAAPVPSGDDHIVADRKGRIARLDTESGAKWEIQLKTLGGIGRTPVFLPSKSGWLLVVSEDGQAWLVQAQSGEVDGPRDIGSPPAVGPALTRSGVSVQFADGRVAVWTDRLEPIFYQADAIVGGPFAKESLIAPNVATLRRSAANAVSELVSPGNGWKVQVTDSEYRVIATDGRGFSAERVGEWVFVAWEAPKALVPHGRLWVSDETGLRSYLPDLEQMVPFPAGR